MKLYNTYIFDLDGTLLYTLGDLTASLNHMMRLFGFFPEYGEETVRKMVGNGIGKLIELAIPGGRDNTRYEDLYLAFTDYYMCHGLDTTKPYDGIADMLGILKRNGKKMAIVSNKRHEATEKLCRHFFSDYISVAIGESSKIRRKPAPDTVAEAMARLGADKESTVYVGDSEVDILTARNSGIPCISVLWGFRDKDCLVKHGAQTLISSPEELTAPFAGVGV